MTFVCLSVCRGVFNQGYLCSKCGLGAHKECLGRFGSCGKTGNTPLLYTHTHTRYDQSLSLDCTTSYQSHPVCNNSALHNSSLNKMFSRDTLNLIIWTQLHFYSGMRVMADTHSVVHKTWYMRASCDYGSREIYCTLWKGTHWVEMWELVREVNKNFTCDLISPTKDIRALDQYSRYKFKSPPASLGGFDTSEVMSLCIIAPLPKA